MDKVHVVKQSGTKLESHRGRVCIIIFFLMRYFHHDIFFPAMGIFLRGFEKPHS